MYLLLGNWIAKHNDSPYCIPIASDEGQEAIPIKRPCNGLNYVIRVVKLLPARGNMGETLEETNRSYK